MDQPTLPPNEPSPAPFSPPPSGRIGGASSVAIGCAVLLLVLGIAAIYALSRADDMFAWTMSRVEQKILSHVGGEVPVDVRSDFRNAMAELIEGVRNNELSPAHLQSVQRELLEVAGKGRGEIDADDLRRLTRALRGEPAAPPRDDPEPAPEAAGDRAAIGEAA